MTQTVDTPGQPEDLRATMLGPVLVAGDPGYDEARVAWNGMFDRRPAVIARCMGVGDVQAAIAYARANDLVIAVRGGGHSSSGASTIEGGVLIDLSLMRGVHVDPERRTAVAAGGTLWSEFDRETQVHGLASTGGMVSHTGVAGLTLGGGVGRFMRKHGLTCDNVLSFDIVTADGTWRHVDAEHEPDLFWALRGGGGDFGIVTHFEFALHPLDPTVYAGAFGWPVAQAREVLAHFHEKIAAAPDELMVQLIVLPGPDLELVPEHLRGEPVLLLNTTWMGPDLDEGARHIDAFGTGPTPAFGFSAPAPYAALQAMSDDMAPHGRRVYSRSGYLADVTEEILDAVVERVMETPSRFCLVELYQMGGAVRRVPADATPASAFRDAEWYYIVGASWFDEADDAAGAAWARGTDEALEPVRLPGRYINFVSDDDRAGQVEALGAETFARLTAVKQAYDPDNVFSRNPNKRAQVASGTSA